MRIVLYIAIALWLLSTIWALVKEYQVQMMKKELEQYSKDNLKRRQERAELDREKQLIKDFELRLKERKMNEVK